MSSISIFVFFITTIAISIFTWQFSIKARRHHGIPRFFAFESILLLVLLNAPVWFSNPVSSWQIISWIFLLVSIIFAIAGFYLLRIIGKPHGDFENTTKLVDAGIYKFIRHPLYASLLLLGTGVFLKNITSETILLAFGNLVMLISTAKLEEKEMLAKFGEEYSGYIKRTKMFIPFLF